MVGLEFSFGQAWPDAAGCATTRWLSFLQLLERRQVMYEWLVQHARPVIDSILYSLLGCVILLGFFWFVQRALPFSMRKEIEEDQNVSLGIILGAFILGLSIIIASAVHG
jgi:hypothetical protein